MWIVFALGAAATWGLTYTIDEHLFKHISVVSALAVTCLVTGIVLGAVALISGEWQRDLVTLVSSSRALWLLIGSTVAFIVGDLLISYAIQSNNATIAGLIEISYPLFIILFSYLIFREENLSLGTAIGGLFIFTGVATIYLFNR
ncbi:MAG: DMT family transporter [Patescibacteria group bacterium]